MPPDLARAAFAVVCAATALPSAVEAALEASDASDKAVLAFVSAAVAAAKAAPAADCAFAALVTPNVPLSYALATAFAVPAKVIEVLSIASLNCTIPCCEIDASGRSLGLIVCAGNVCVSLKVISPVIVPPAFGRAALAFVSAVVATV